MIAAILVTVCLFQEADFRAEAAALIAEFASDSITGRNEAAGKLEALAEKKGQGSLAVLRDAIAAEKDVQVRSYLTAVLGRLTNPRVLWAAVGGASDFYAAAPVVAGDVCYCAGGNGLYALDANSGGFLWRLEGDFQHARPAIFGTTVITPSPFNEPPGIQALEMKTGKVVWKHPLVDLRPDAARDQNPFIQDCSIVLDGDRVLTGTRAGSIVCLRAATGERLWAPKSHHASHTFWDPTVAGSRVLSADWNKSLCSFDAGTGKLQWEALIPGIGANPPTVIDDVAYAGTHEYVDGKERGECIAISITDGRQLWHTRVDNHGMKVISSAAASGSRVAFQTDTHVVGLSKKDGRFEWSVPAKRFGYARLASDANGCVFAGTDDMHLLAIAPTGRETMRLDIDAMPETKALPRVEMQAKGRDPIQAVGPVGDPIVIGRVLYVRTTSGIALAIRLPVFLTDGKPWEMTK